MVESAEPVDVFSVQRPLTSSCDRRSHGMADSQFTPKLCECGCGQTTTINKVTDRSRGYVKGQPCRFVTGHFSNRSAAFISAYARKPRRKQSINLRDYILERSIPEPTTGCWLLSASVDRDGYGIASLRQIERKAHRLSYAAFVAPIPETLHALHRCDTPPCVNPDHLFLGTNADNVRDMHAKGRGRNGNGHL